jgi:hypothetical protein
VSLSGIKPGDLVAFSGQSLVSDLINLGTYGVPRWSASHVGVIADAADGRQLLFESTTLDALPCEISGKRFNGVQAHGLDKVVETYQGKVWLYPLYRPLFDFEEQRLSRFLVGLVGTPYDELKAFRAAGTGFSWFESMLHEEALNHIFCSELVAAAYSDDGIMPTDDAARWNPNHLIRHLRQHQLLLRAKRLK